MQKQVMDRHCGVARLRGRLGSRERCDFQEAAHGTCVGRSIRSAFPYSIITELFDEHLQMMQPQTWPESPLQTLSRRLDRPLNPQSLSRRTPWVTFRPGSCQLPRCQTESSRQPQRGHPMRWQPNLTPNGPGRPGLSRQLMAAMPPESPCPAGAAPPPSLSLNSFTLALASSDLSLFDLTC